MLNYACSKSKNAPVPDNPYGLPNATQTGANVFACRINGKNFISYYNLFNTKATFLTGDTMWIVGTQNLSKMVYQDISFKLNTNISTNSFEVSKNNCIVQYNTDSICTSNQTQNITSYSKDAFIIITRFDKKLKIISGTINGTFPIKGCDTVFVTDGRFDFNYY